MQFAAVIVYRGNSSVLTQLEVGEHTPLLSFDVSLLVRHGVLALSLLGKTEVCCSVLVSRLSLSFPAPPSSLILHHPPSTSLCYVSEARSGLHNILPHPVSCSPLLPSSLSPMSN